MEVVVVVLPTRLSLNEIPEICPRWSFFVCQRSRIRFSYAMKYWNEFNLIAAYNGFNYNFATSSFPSVPWSRCDHYEFNNNVILWRASGGGQSRRLLYSLLLPLSLPRPLLIFPELLPTRCEYSPAGNCLIWINIWGNDTQLCFSWDGSQRIPIGTQYYIWWWATKFTTIESWYASPSCWRISPLDGGLCWTLLWLPNHTQQVLLPTWNEKKPQNHFSNSGYAL